MPPPGHASADFAERRPGHVFSFCDLLLNAHPPAADLIRLQPGDTLTARYPLHDLDLRSHLTDKLLKLGPQLAVLGQLLFQPRLDDGSVDLRLPREAVQVPAGGLVTAPAFFQLAENGLGLRDRDLAGLVEEVLGLCRHERRDRREDSGRQRFHVASPSSLYSM